MAQKIRVCVVFGCFNATWTNPGLNFYPLPNSRARLAEWLRLINREDLWSRFTLDNMYVCEKHFKKEDIRYELPYRSVLDKGALPSLHLPVKMDKKEVKKLEMTHVIDKEEHNSTHTSCTPSENSAKEMQTSCVLNEKGIDSEYVIVVKMDSDKDISDTEPSNDVVVIESDSEEDPKHSQPLNDAVKRETFSVPLHDLKRELNLEGMEMDCSPLIKSRKPDSDGVNIDKNTVEVCDVEISEASNVTQYEVELESRTGKSIEINESISENESEEWSNLFHRVMFSADADNAVINKILISDMDLSRNNVIEVMKKFNFEGQREMLLPVSDNFPGNFFKIFINDNFLKMLVHNTNKHARSKETETIKNVTKKNNAEEFNNNWKDLSVKELRVFLGLLLHMGTFKFDQISDYWFKDRLAKTCFASIMSLNRFLQILNNLTFTSKQNDTDRFWKIRPIINYLNNVVKGSYSPDKILIVDDSVWQEHGDSSILHDVAKNEEPSESCTRVYLLREPNGMILKFEIFAPTDSNAKSSDEIIFDLASEKLDIGHSLYLQSHQTSLNLALKLLRRKTYCTGILSEQAVSIPETLSQAQLSVHGHKSVLIAGIRIGKWRKSHDKEVLYLSSEYEDKMISDKGSSYKPHAVFAMSTCSYKGLDDLDTYYPHKNIRLPNHRRIFIQILMLVLVNTHWLYDKYVRGIDFNDFRMGVIDHLLYSEESKLSIPHRLETYACMSIDYRKKVCCKCLQVDNIERLTIYRCQECHHSPSFCIKCFCDVHC